VRAVWIREMIFALAAATAGGVESDATPGMRDEPGEGLNDLVAAVSIRLRVLLRGATSIDEDV